MADKISKLRKSNMVFDRKIQLIDNDLQKTEIIAGQESSIY